MATIDVDVPDIDVWRRIPSVTWRLHRLEEKRDVPASHHLHGIPIQFPRSPAIFFLPVIGREKAKEILTGDLTG